jgi:hypothetical protein
MVMVAVMMTTVMVVAVVVVWDYHWIVACLSLVR